MNKIFGLQNVVRTMEHRDVVVRFRSKVKLHGTNAGIYFDENGNAHPMKKSGIIPDGEDNFGFAEYVHSREWPRYENIYVFGEWAGPGIQKGVAVSQIPEKTFFTFMAMNSDKELILNTGVLEDMFDVPTVPWFDPHPFTLDYKHRKTILDQIDIINENVEEIERCDPYIKQKYGIEGVGEGLVFYPIFDRMTTSEEFKEYGFKVKGEKHAVSKAGKPARIKSTVPESAYEFADMHLTDARLQQGVQEVGLDITKTGAFIGWICKDISTECALEIEESGMPWKGCLSGVIARKAADYYKEKCNEI